MSELAPSGRPAMRSSLRVIATLIDRNWTDLDDILWHKLRRKHAQAIRTELVKRYRPRSANRMLSAFRQVLKRCWQDERIPHDEYLLVVDIKPIPLDDEDTGRALSPKELESLIQVAREQPDPKGTRDAALVAVLYGAGLRRVEAARATPGAYNRRTKEIRVQGKGSKYRTVPLIPGWERDLEDWLDLRDEAEEQLFGLHVDSIGRALRDLSAVSEISFTTHDLRRSFATHLIDNGVDLSLVKMLMGHKNIQTTTVYDKRSDEAKRKAVAVIARGRR